MHGNLVFITGSSGFIGSNLAKRILTTEPDTKVIGLDNMNDYYDVRIKEARLAELQKFANYTFIQGNLADKELVNSIFQQYHPNIVVNLGAQAGVRYSITIIRGASGVCLQLFRLWQQQKSPLFHR